MMPFSKLLKILNRLLSGEKIDNKCLSTNDYTDNDMNNVSKISNIEQNIQTISKKIEELTEDMKWKSEKVNLAEHQKITIEEISKYKEIYVVGRKNSDTVNGATMMIIKNTTNKVDYYQMEAFHWQGNYPIAVYVNWDNGDISNQASESNIIEIGYR